MRITVLFFGILAFAGTLLSQPTAATAQDAPQYDFRSIDVPGAVESDAWGINERGDVVGKYFDAAGNVHGFLLRGEKFTTIDIKGSEGNSARDINDLGQIAGNFGDSAGVEHGYLMTRGTIREIDFPGADNTDVSALNDLGDVAGGLFGNDGSARGFFSRAGRLISFEVPGSAPGVDDWPWHQRPGPGRRVLGRPVGRQPRLPPRPRALHVDRLSGFRDVGLWNQRSSADRRQLFLRGWARPRIRLLIGKVRDHRLPTARQSHSGPFDQQPRGHRRELPPGRGNTNSRVPRDATPGGIGRAPRCQSNSRSARRGGTRKKEHEPAAPRQSPARRKRS